MCYIKSIKKETNYQEIIGYIINFDKSHKEGYHLLQDLYKIAKLSPHREAKKDILNWLDKIAELEDKLLEFKTVRLSYKSRINEITNSF